MLGSPTPIAALQYSPTLYASAVHNCLEFILINSIKNSTFTSPMIFTIESEERVRRFLIDTTLELTFGLWSLLYHHHSMYFNGRDRTVPHELVHFQNAHP